MESRPLLEFAASSVHSKVITLDPGLAKQCLGANCANRPLMGSRVSYYAGIIDQGDWKLSHQGLAFDKQGYLIDGQHRCAAVLASGKPVQILATCGLDRDVFDVVDTGKARTGGDVLSVAGAKNASVASSAIRHYLYYCRVPHMVWVGINIGMVTNRDILAFYQSRQDVCEWAAHVARACRAKNVCIPGPFAALALIAVIDRKYPRSFIENLGTALRDGANLPADNPILQFRKRFYDGAIIGSSSHSRAKSASNKSQAYLASYIKLVNLVVNGASLRIFKQAPMSPMPSLEEYQEAA